MKAFTILACSLLLNTAVFAEENPLAWKAHRNVAARISDFALAGQLTAQTISAWKNHDLKCHGIRIGITILATETIKRLVGRRRPDGSDYFSFPSGHTAMAAANAGWNRSAGIMFTANIGLLRGGANKHYLSDIGFGATIGAVTHWICGRD